jgi:rod shape-determining protein MreD
MRSTLTIAAAALLAALLQTTVLAAIPGLPVVPDLLLVLAVYLGLHHHGLGGVTGAFLLGYLLDTFSGTVLGLNAFAMTAAYATVHFVARTVWTEGWPSTALVVLVAAGVQQLALAVAAALVEDPTPVWQHVWRYGVWEAVVAAAVAPAVFAFLAWERRLVGAAT